MRRTHSEHPLAIGIKADRAAVELELHNAFHDFACQAGCWVRLSIVMLPDLFQSFGGSGDWFGRIVPSGTTRNHGPRFAEIQQ